MKLPTVFALSTPPGRSGIAVIRITGDAAPRILRELTGCSLPGPRTASRRRLVDENGSMIDDALVLFFPAPSSVTGEDVVELHCHGGRAVTAAVLSWLSGFDGVLPAAPGEFTQRAFINGKMDLTEVEASGALLAAETEAQRKQAVQAAGGGVQRIVAAVRHNLVQALALVEATIDWSDEDVPEDVGPEVSNALASARSALRGLLEGAGARERLMEGFEVVLIGAPNAGKSSLINAIVGREVALATPISGTTRDIIEARLDLRGLPITLIDTAGFHESVNVIEEMGMARGRERAARADLRLFIDAPEAPLPLEVAQLHSPGDLTVSNKADLAFGAHMPVSARTGEGLEALVEQMAAVLQDRVPTESGIAEARQRAEVGAGLESVDLAISGLGVVGTEIVAEYLRGALASLERLAGRTTPEAVLGEVFSKFCLGK
ncbi:MAG: tRNA uridine-5-carboxymethylaminomethyl(34) synthesis GTPase MnmE [Pseudomonadota bacterium]